MQNTWDFRTTWSINYANSNLVSDGFIIPNLHLTGFQIGPIGQEVHLEKSSNKNNINVCNNMLSMTKIS